MFAGTSNLGDNWPGFNNSLPGSLSNSISHYQPPLDNKQSLSCELSADDLLHTSSVCVRLSAQLGLCVP
jgi:hypothetical protein